MLAASFFFTNTISMKHLVGANMPLVISYLMPLMAAALVVGMEPSSPPVPSSAIARPGCRSECGNVTIPYPFGVGAKCAWPGLGNFTITCNQSFSPPRPYIGNIEVTNILLEEGEMHVYSIHSSICSPKTNCPSDGGLNVTLTLTPPFLISPTRNAFTAIGCNTLAIVEGSKYYISACISVEEAAQDGEKCSGLGCCQTSLPANLSTITFSLGNVTDNDFAWRYNPCSYAFVADKDWYNFTRGDLARNNFSSRVAGGSPIPLVLDWAIRGNESCRSTPKGTLTAPACVSANSECVHLNATQGGGYRCNCSKGYQGNPYLNGGCTDIDECELRERFPEMYKEKIYPCGKATICRNIPGAYVCDCKFGHVLAAPKNEGEHQGDCQPIFSGIATAILVTIVSSFILLVLLYFLRKEKQRRVRIGCFDKNGGEILEGMNIKTFTEVELEKMTNRYSERIGKGHFGEVFKGRITDGDQLVAVKRPILGGSKKNQQNNGREFVDEIIFQFKLSHANLVRLIGCCLETNVPRLVFDFISNGSLYDKLHGADKCALSLTKRLDIAIGSAEAVSYMHSHGDHKHVHGDIKSANILLDGDLMPKVSDFGSCKLLSIDMYTSAVAADRNYVDPVYMKTDRFTAKSDVYSFGVVLLELLTGKTAKYGENNSLPIDFIKCCKEEGNGRVMYDQDILTNHGDDTQSSQVYMECLDKIGELAVRCLKEVDVDERPTMAEVVDELKHVKSMVTGMKLTFETG